MNLKLTIFLFFFMFLAIQGQEKKYVSVKRNIKLMGSPFEFTVVVLNEEIGYINIDEAVAEIKRIEKLISSWDPASETSLINANAGIRPVKVSYELFKLIERAIQISEITNGAFDITVASMDTLWKFDGSMRYLPSASAIQQAVSKMGYRKIVLNPKESTVFLKEKGMKLGFGAIGKGYAADKAKELLVSKQVPAGMINAAGDITTWGTKATGEKWMIGVSNQPGSQKLFSWIPLVESSVAITGIREKYVLFDGKKYSNILDPRTGYPVSGISRVTILSKSAELSDALATAVYVLGRDKGLALINQLGGTEVIIIDNKEQLYKSNGVLLDTN